jgi:hypothetical protein
MKCEYEDTCPNKTDTCEVITMTDLYAKPIIDGKFWIVEQDGIKVGLLLTAIDTIPDTTTAMHI